MNLNIGDHVSVIDEELEGVVVDVKDEHVILCDYSGKLIRQFELPSQECEIDLSFLDQGMYVLHFVQSGVKKKISKK